jgi:hypothetical protein
MIIKQTIVLNTPRGRIETTFALDVGVNFRDQHEALQYLNALTNKLGLMLNEDPIKWQPQVSF